jgi:hypothetical protein
MFPGIMGWWKSIGVVFVDFVKNKIEIFINN